MSDGENPYQSPHATGEATDDGSSDRRDLRAVAVYQRNVQFCALAFVALFGVHLGMVGTFSPSPSPPTAVIIAIVLLALLWLVVMLASVVFFFLLAMKVYHPVIAILLVLLTFVPCINLLSLLAINSRATEVLRKNGCHVGLLGADLSQFP